MASPLAATVTFPSFEGIGRIGNVSNAGSCTGGIICAIGKLGAIISVVIGILTVSAGLWFIFQVFAGALQWLGSSGDKQALESARKRITHAAAGLLIVILSYAFISIVGLVFGIDILGLSIINNLTPQ
ncbi:hypothetical protein A2876_01155 [Candidatus Amesbacteria bacterium RIFCSPHIGHO2_01_FULL_48_32b]|uniref:Uncharacterized protein n=1 Tax=Candidatus Amesbacteria bacterium RIFCSPHIGHO2_01_FULL_48_32b TaxID=1797253 RepID=A0A1F4YGQ7_9BACT|nr:MAG: hypothetical protein A2876_01155 [Candidatus Amesbacteria bacterium RIFCSPHIGHO2_01_FULL_48_32b]